MLLKKRAMCSSAMPRSSMQPSGLVNSRHALARPRHRSTHPPSSSSSLSSVCALGTHWQGGNGHPGRVRSTDTSRVPWARETGGGRRSVQARSVHTGVRRTHFQFPRIDLAQRLWPTSALTRYSKRVCAQPARSSHACQATDRSNPLRRACSTRSCEARTRAARSMQTWNGTIGMVEERGRDTV